MKGDRRTVLFLLSCLVLVFVQWPTIRELIAYARSDSTNASQVLLIPFVSAALIFWDRQRIFNQVRYSVLPGVLVAATGIVLMVTSRSSIAPAADGDRIALATAAALTIWMGLFVGFFGVDAFRAGMFPLLFLVFTIPIPGMILKQVITLLQRGSAEISLILLRLTGTPVFRDDFVFHMPRVVPAADGNPYMSIAIAPECSGIRSFLSMLILTILAGNLLLQTTWRRIALVLVAIPIMIFKNALRIATLTLLSIHVDPRIIESRLHREGGIPFFLVALLLTYPVLKILMKTEKAEKQDPGQHSILREANL